MDVVAAVNATPDRTPVRVCDKCKSFQVLRVEQTFLDLFFSLQRFECGRCMERSTRIQPGWPALAQLLFFVILAGGAYYFSTSRFQLRSRESSVSEVELLTRARQGSGRLSTFEEMMMKKPRPTLDNATILELWKNKVDTAVILQMIRTYNANYDLSASDVIALRKANIDQNIILEMINANYLAAR